MVFKFLGLIKALDRIQTESRHQVSTNADAARAEIMSLNGANTSSTHTIYVRKVEANATGGLVGGGVRRFADGGAAQAERGPRSAAAQVGADRAARHLQGRDLLLGHHARHPRHGPRGPSCRDRGGRVRGDDVGAPASKHAEKVDSAKYWWGIAAAAMIGDSRMPKAG